MHSRWMVLGSCLLGAQLFVACGDGSADESPNGGGSAGAPGAGSGGSAGNAGGSGGEAGKPSGGAAQGGSGSPEGGQTTSGSGGAAGAGGESEGGAGGEATGGPIRAVMGERCSLSDAIGLVQLAGFPDPYVQVSLSDQPEPWIGEPKLTNATCDFYRFVAGVCDGCEAGEVCSHASECVPEPRTIKDAELVVNVGGEQRQYFADEQLGGIYGMLDIGSRDSSFAMQLRWGETVVELSPMKVASGELEALEIEIEGDSSAPGALDATWEPREPGSFVRTRIPINHHAAAATFTECIAPASAGGFHADAEMVDPLAVSTGLEFQGVEHVYIAAAQTPQGCVEFRFGPQLLVFPE